MNWKKLYSEGAEEISEPKVYVGTYGKYNDGSIDGEWVTLTDFDTYEDFMDYIRELHSDEKDPEFMFQDYEGFPSSWYSEGGMSAETFEKILEYSELSPNEQEAYEAFTRISDRISDDDSIDSFRDRFIGHFNSPSDLGYDIVEQVGMPGNPESYFDYDSFGRDLMMDYSMGDPDIEDADGEPQDEDHYYDQDGYDMGEYRSDRQVAEDFIDSMGSIEELGKDTIERYFDYDSFGRDLLIDDYTQEDGYVFSNY